MIIRVKNDLTETAPKTALAAKLSSGGTTVGVYNVNGFYDNWNIQLGNTDEEKAEIIEISGTPSGTAINLGTTITFEHPADTPVYSLKYNQVVFKRSTVGTSGTAVEIASGTINIAPDQEFTQFDDTTGSVSYAYKAAFRSTGLASTGSDSDWLKGQGADFYSLAKVRSRIRTKALNGDILEDGEIDEWINEWLEKMTNAAIDVNEDYALGTTEISFSGTVQEGTITSEDFKQVRRAWHTGDGSTWYQMTKQDFVDFIPSEIFNETNPFFYMKGDNIIGRNPHDASGTIGLTYYKLNPILDSDADQLPVPFRGYTGTFVKWGVGQAYRKDKMIQEAMVLEAQAENDLQQFVSEISNRNKSGPTYIDLVEALPDDETLWW